MNSEEKLVWLGCPTRLIHADEGSFFAAEAKNKAPPSSNLIAQLPLESYSQTVMPQAYSERQILPTDAGIVSVF